jgi:TolB-like protein
MPPKGSSKIKFEIGHVLFIDIVGYSKLLITEQTEQIQKLTEIVRGTEQFRIAETEGKLLRLPTGDGGALVFGTSPEAPVLCAMEIGKALKTHPELQVRIGIHSGPVNEITDLNEQANIAGAGINIAQRVMDCGDAGHILLSKHVADDLEHYPQWRSLLHDLGECEVKHGWRVGIVNLYEDEIGNSKTPDKLQVLKRRQARSRRVAFAASLMLLVVLIGASLFIYKRSLRGTSNLLEKSVAVLPFENLSEEKANAYFADGIQDEILTRLSKIGDLKVISRTSTEHYKSAPENLPEIGRQLRVAHIVEGSVQKSGDEVRVNVKLIKVTNDLNLWADTFDRKLTDIFAVESEIAKSIADRLQAKLTGQEELSVADKPTSSTQAYDAYLRGLVYATKTARSSANDIEAQKYLREAVRLDPNFALSWAWLSYVDASGYISLSLQPTDALRQEAKHAATAERYFQQARQFLPNNSLIPMSLAYLTRRRGEWDRSESFFKEAERLNPRDVALLTQHALSLLNLRQFRDAADKLNQILNIAPDDPYPVTLKAAIAQMQGDLATAAALLAPLHPTADNTQILETQVYQSILERAPASMIARLTEILAHPDPALGYNIGDLRFYLGWAREVAGDHAGAETSWRQACTELEPLLKEQHGNYLLISALALSRMGLGQRDEALALAEQAMEGNPIENDALIGARPLEIFARVTSQRREPERAIPAIQKLLSMTYSGAIARQLSLTPALLRLDPMFDPLRNDPRFQKLCEDKPK